MLKGMRHVCRAFEVLRSHPRDAVASQLKTSLHCRSNMRSNDKSLTALPWRFCFDFRSVSVEKYKSALSVLRYRASSAEITTTLRNTRADGQQQVQNEAMFSLPCGSQRERDHLVPSATPVLRFVVSALAPHRMFGLVAPLRKHHVNDGFSFKNDSKERVMFRLLRGTSCSGSTRQSWR